MAEETVVKEPLTSEMIAMGRQLTERLDAIDFEVTTCFWLYSSEANQWRLVLVSPKLDIEGPRKIYAKIQSVLSTHRELASGLNLTNITVFSPNHALVKSLRSAIRTGRQLSGIRFSQNRINNTYIEDAYIYRVS